MRILTLIPERKTGNAAVDSQHQFFADLINRISENLLVTKDHDYKEKLLSELIKYGTFHFTSEENIAFSRKLKGLHRHRERHLELIDELEHSIQKLLLGGCSTDDFIKFLHDWFIGHTMYEDHNLFKS